MYGNGGFPKLRRLVQNYKVVFSQFSQKKTNVPSVINVSYDKTKLLFLRTPCMLVNNCLIV